MTDAAFVAADGVRLAYEHVGDGPPVLWQHGLGADRSQPAEVFPAGQGWSRITFECRGHGASELGGADRISIATFAQDALGLLDHLGIARAAVGGISLGAAVALRLAFLRPERVTGLVLARPAWLDRPAPETLRIYAEIADLIAEHGTAGGAERAAALPELAAVAAVSPDNAQSLMSFFRRPDPRSTVALLSRIPRDGPGLDRAALAALSAPTLVVANDQDYVHPLATARALAGLIPGARLAEITSKTIDRAAYVTEFRAALASFLATLEPGR
jgi:pimeloyl-ACP methyl ester carboxylesterase